ncbi:hypothetical protein ROI_27530 [Roseburia intestinalis M50/1]|nr:hypothetical protein ROI_27530 [Roseburia intestinalis M50/1]
MITAEIVMQAINNNEI